MDQSNGGPLSNGPMSNGPMSNGPMSNMSANLSENGFGQRNRRLEDWQLPTILYFLAFHKKRFRFPRIRLTDLERVLDNPDTGVLRDILARILRVMRGGDPNVTMQNAEQQLALYFQEKRPQIAKQLSASKLDDLGFESKTRLLKKVIDYLNDDLIPNWEMEMRYDSQQQDDCGAINCGADRRNRRHFYLDDHRLYRQRFDLDDSIGGGGGGSSGGPCSVGSVGSGCGGGASPPASQQAYEMVVGPCAEDWEKFTNDMLASKNENERDLGGFLQHPMSPMYNQHYHQQQLPYQQHHQTLHHQQYPDYYSQQSVSCYPGSRSDLPDLSQQFGPSDCFAPASNTRPSYPHQPATCQALHPQHHQSSPQLYYPNPSGAPAVRVFTSHMANDCARQCLSSPSLKPDKWHQACVERMTSQQQAPVVTPEQLRKREEKIQRIKQIGQSVGLSAAAAAVEQPPPPPLHSAVSSAAQSGAAAAAAAAAVA
uniref:Histone acetyltransferase n=1 Tax=Macrostomum lignano TaxID=282301 RepID=A0A1I8J858_9PLAT